MFTPTNETEALNQYIYESSLRTPNEPFTTLRFPKRTPEQEARQERIWNYVSSAIPYAVGSGLAYYFGDATKSLISTLSPTENPSLYAQAPTSEVLQATGVTASQVRSAQALFSWGKHRGYSTSNPFRNTDLYSIPEEHRRYLGLPEPRSYRPTLKRMPRGRKRPRSKYVKPGDVGQYTYKSDGINRYLTGSTGRQAIFRVPSRTACGPGSLEMKNFDAEALDVTYSVSEAHASSTFDSFLDIAQNTTPNGRVGRKARIHSIQFTYSVHGTGTSTVSAKFKPFVLKLWYDGQANADSTVPAIEKVVVKTIKGQVVTNLDNIARFAEVWSSPILAPPSTAYWNGTQTLLQDNHALSQEAIILFEDLCIDYTGTSGVIDERTSSNLFFTVHSLGADFNLNPAVVSISSRVLFTDS
jgi:hypothetical protein